MGKYKVLIKPSAVREIEDLPRKKDRQSVVQRLEQLANEPRPPGCQKLSGRDLYRVRQGYYQVVYEVRESDLVVTTVKDRDRK
ncbi:MAG: type II toxin-antitoxin system RelE family toxin [Pseudomonadales bacterium]